MIAPALPLIDLHRHLDGNVRLNTILELARQHNISLPAKTAESLRPHVQVLEPTPSLMAFIAKFRWLTAVMADLDACRRIAYENLLDAKREGLDYLELRFSPWFMAETHQLSVTGVVEAVLDGIRSGSQETGIPVGVIGILTRTYGVETCHKELQAFLPYREQLVAIDLAGDEGNFPARWFVEHFRLVRSAGLGVTVHAGEAGGAGSVWDAVRLLGATRIGHCVRAFLKS
jgi:adenosine deaminase